MLIIFLKILKGAEYGAVTALGINMECTRLLCGHARGQVREEEQIMKTLVALYKD